MIERSEHNDVPPDVDNPDAATEPDPAFDETDDQSGETPEAGEPDEGLD